MTDEERREHRRNYYRANRERELAHCKKYYLEHRDKVLEYQRQWHQEHPNYAREYSRKWKQAHREQYLAYMRNYYAEKHGKEGAIEKYIPEGCAYPDCLNCTLPDCEREGV